MTGWAGRLVAGAVLAAVAVDAWVVQYGAQELPGWDAALYLDMAIELWEHLSEGAWSRAAARALRPDLHPPLHGMSLGAWLHLFGDHPWTARSHGAVWTLLGALLCAPIARMVDVRREWIGWVAGFLVLCSLEHRRLLDSTMTEPTALVVTQLGLLAALRLHERRGLRGGLVLGCVFVLAAAVRYNLGPMLWLAVLAWSLWLARGHEVGGVLRRSVLWLLPSVVALGSWQALWSGVRWSRGEPDELAVLGSVHAFFVNRASESVGLWTRFTWPVQALDTHYLGLFTVLLMVVCLVAGTVRATRERHTTDPVARRLFLLHLFGWTGLILLALHPYREPRNLYVFVPVLVLVTLFELERLVQDRSGWRRS
ncbi:MAG: glycosyltransferase family 39 protein, partial [Myxococcota bacterium]|nr:glycosyltransferase family 39 protein [Myxococcota bacterium]